MPFNIVWVFFCILGYLFHFSFSRRVFLNIPLFDEFIRIPKKKSDKPRAMAKGDTLTNLPKEKKNKVIWSSLQMVSFYLFFVNAIFIVFRFRGISFAFCGSHFSFVDFLFLFFFSVWHCFFFFSFLLPSFEYGKVS